LATEYNVTVRTLQRDFNQRLSYLPVIPHLILLFSVLDGDRPF
jgi:predicted DNA-binding transcriptional regulator YafY